MIQWTIYALGWTWETSNMLKVIVALTVASIWLSKTLLLTPMIANLIEFDQWQIFKVMLTFCLFVNSFPTSLKTQPRMGAFANLVENVIKILEKIFDLCLAMKHIIIVNLIHSTLTIMLHVECKKCHNSLTVIISAKCTTEFTTS